MSAAEKVGDYPRARSINSLSDDAMNEVREKMATESLLHSSSWTIGFSIFDGTFWFLCALYLSSISAAPLAVGLVWGYAIARAGFVMHMSIHQGVFQSFRYNRVLAIITQNLLIGVSWRWWKHIHNRHHQHCNVASKDPDLKTQPLIVYSEKLATGEVTTIQRWLIPLYMFLLIPVWRVTSILKCLRKGWYEDLAWTGLHWVCLLALFAKSDYSTLECFAMWNLSSFVAGAYMLSVFMMNHLLEEVLEDDHGMNLCLHTIRTTRNIEVRGGPWAESLLWYVFGGLNLQIEHHLFPSCPVDKLPRVAYHVKRACAKRGLEYRTETPWATAIELWQRLAAVEEIAKARLAKE